MNKVLFHGKFEEMPVLLFFPDKKKCQSMIEICQGVLVCKLDGEKEYYPIVASGELSVELMEAARMRINIDVAGFFRHFCWENDNLERHMSYYLLVTDIYFDGKEVKDVHGDTLGKNTVVKMIRDKRFVPINLLKQEDLIKKLLC